MIVSCKALSVFDVLILIFLIFLFEPHKIVVSVLINIINIVSTKYKRIISEVTISIVIWIIVLVLVVRSAVRTSFLFGFFFFFSFLISNNFYISLINNFIVTNRFLVWYWNWNLSNNRNFLYIRSWNGNRSSNSYSIINRILNVVNIVLLKIFLNNWLCNNFFGRNLNSFVSDNIIYLNRFGNCV